MIHYGDATQVLKTLPDNLVQACITSPPYWGLRSYLEDTDPSKPLEIGCEPTPEEYIEKLVTLFREVRRVLREDGTLWVNIGDTYASLPPGNKIPRGERLNGGLHSAPKSKGRVISTVVGDLKEKDLVGIPWMLAFALRQDGWYLRSDIIWNKLENIPESVKDRASKAHEYIFMFSKSKKNYYDKDAVPEAARSVWSIATKHKASEHTAVYPEELPVRCLLCSTKSGDKVLDPFAGSGTTLAAAIELGRDPIGIELNTNCQGEIDRNVQIAQDRVHHMDVFDSLPD